MNDITIAILKLIGLTIGIILFIILIIKVSKQKFEGDDF